jgi:hypothetical protein
MSGAPCSPLGIRNAEEASAVPLFCMHWRDAQQGNLTQREIEVNSMPV